MKRLLALVIGCCFALAAGAQEWPQRPVKFVVAFAPGGANDIVTRLLAENLSQRQKQQFIVEIERTPSPL